MVYISTHKVYGDPQIISPFDPGSIGVELASTGVAAPSAAAWPAANRMIAYPVILRQPMLVTKVWWHSGGTAANLKVGVYDSAYNQIFIDASRAKGTGTALVEQDVTDFWVPAGLNYIVCVTDSGTGTLFRAAMMIEACKVSGMWQQAITYASPPNPATPAAIAAAYLPIVGVSARAVTA